MDSYSLTLLASIAALVAGLGAALGAPLLRDRVAGRPSLLAFARRAMCAALVLVAISAVHHFAAGHRPGSPAALGPLAFMAEHLSFAIVPALAAAGLLWIARYARGPR